MDFNTETIGDISVIFASIAAIIAAGVAVYGIKSWKREYLGKRKIELAEEVLVLFYEACDAIRFIRNTFGYSGEGTTRKGGEHETDGVKKAKDQACVTFERYNNTKNTFNKLRSKRHQFAVHFGKDCAHNFDEINRIVADIIASSRSLSTLWSSGINNDKTREYESRIWDDKKEDDPINPELDKIVKNIEGICENEISPQNKFKASALRSLIEFIDRLRRSRPVL